MFKDFIAKLPIDVIRKVEIEPNRLVVPTEINAQEVYKAFQTEIDAPGLGEEKALYLAAVNTPKPTMTIKTLLVRGR